VPPGLDRRREDCYQFVNGFARRWSEFGKKLMRLFRQEFAPTLGSGAISYRSNDSVRSENALDRGTAA
jgi:hypothetical protein